MISILYLYFLFHFLAFADAVSHSSSTASSASLNKPELFLRKKRNLTWGKIQDLPIVDEKEVAQIRNKAYSKRYRQAHPSRVKQSVQQYRQRLKKDPIRLEKTRLRVSKYNKEYSQRRKLAKLLESSKNSTNKEDLSNDVIIKSKRKERNVAGENSSKRVRVLHYGRPPMSSAFINSNTRSEKPTSSSDTSAPNVDKRPEKVIEKQRNLNWGKSLNLPVIDKKQLIKQRNVGYSRKYRRLHPDRARESGQRYHENIRKDPIKWQENRLKRKEYNAKYKQKIKLARDSERKTEKRSKKSQSNKPSILTGKRKEFLAEADVSSKRLRVLHYGRPPMSNGFIPPKPKHATDRESALHLTHTTNENEADSQRPRHIVRIKLAKHNAKSSSSANQNLPQKGANY